MKIFNLYLFKRSFYFSIFILFIFGALDTIFVLISELEYISSKYTFYNICDYVFSSIPHRIIDYLEGACLLGAILSLGTSHQEGNLNVLRSAGRSPIQIVLISAAGATLLALPMLIFDDILLRKIYLNAESEKNVLLEKEIPNTSKTWVKDNDSYLSFQNISDDAIYGIQFIKILNNELNYFIQSDKADIIGDEIIFGNDINFLIPNSSPKKFNNTETFEIPLRSRISFNSISHLSFSELLEYRFLFIENTSQEDRLLKSHIEKTLIKKLYLPISIAILIAFFGSFIFTSLRNSTTGGRVIFSVIGAFLYGVLQDLSIGVFISYKLPILLGVIIPSLILTALSYLSYKRI